MAFLIDDQIRERYPWLGRFTTEHAHAFVHDVVSVSTNNERYALKLYRPGVRSDDDIRWEVALSSHLLGAGAPIVRLVEGINGPIESIEVDGVRRFAVMSEWAPGEKPLPPHEDTFRLLGRSAAALHAAAGTFETDFARASLDVTTLLDAQLALLKRPFEECGRWTDVASLGEKLRHFVDSSDLDWGVCHNDLTLDNVHVDGGKMTVFDLDSACSTWRALEPALTYDSTVEANPAFWQAWLDGYREVRDLPDVEISAIPLFSIMYQFENIAWKLGLTPTTVGPLITPEELPGVVDNWLKLYERALV